MMFLTRTTLSPFLLPSSPFSSPFLPSSPPVPPSVPTPPLPPSLTHSIDPTAPLLLHSLSPDHLHSQCRATARRSPPRKPGILSPSPPAKHSLSLAASQTFPSHCCQHPPRSLLLSCSSRASHSHIRSTYSRSASLLYTVARSNRASNATPIPTLSNPHHISCTSAPSLTHTPLRACSWSTSSPCTSRRRRL